MRDANAVLAALALAGITPAALAADPECVRKLVEAASRHTKLSDCDCDSCGSSEGGVHQMNAALRACGIEVGA